MNLNSIITIAAANVNLVGDKQNTLLANINTIIDVIIGLMGIVAVVVMIIGGITYMTSSGDAGKVKKGKDTILYGVIGLVVCALAFAIVNWVIGGLLGGGENNGGDNNATSNSKQCELDGGRWVSDGKGGGTCETTK